MDRFTDKEDKRMNFRSALLCAVIAASLPGLGAAAEKTTPVKQAQAGGASLVAGLPDLTGTALGFAVNGFVEWGGSTVIDQPGQIKATKAGPNQDLCIIGTGLYRTFITGHAAAGGFSDIVYRNGSPVHIRQVAALAPKKTVDFENHDLPFQEGVNVLLVKMDVDNNVAESDENNVFQVKVFVKHDCNGDGAVAGSLPFKNPSRPEPVRKTPGAMQQKSQ
jgi:hypothetical protein